MTDPAAPIRIWHQSFTVLADVPEYAATMRRHLSRCALPGTTIDFHGMRPGTYPTSYPGTHIGYSYLSSLHREQFVAAAIEAERQGYDAFMIATIPDTGFEEARAVVDIPVLGFGNTSVAFAATLAPNVGIVNFIEALHPQLRRNMQLYGFGDIVGPIVAIERGFDDVMAAYSNPEPLLEAFTAAARVAISAGAQVIVPGEAPLNVFLADHGVSRVEDVPVIDSLGVLLAACENRVRMFRATGLKPSRRGFYFERPSAGAIEQVRSFYFGDFPVGDH
jgi:allantoin racemase